MELTKEYFDQQFSNLARKEDFEQLQDDLRDVKTDINEIRQTLIELNKRDKEDSDAFAKTFVKHDQRLNTLENDVKQLKLKSV